MENLLNKKWIVYCENIHDVVSASKITNQIMFSQIHSFSLYADISITEYDLIDSNFNQYVNDSYVKDNLIDNIKYTVYYNHLPHILNKNVFLSLDEFHLKKYSQADVAGVIWSPQIYPAATWIFKYKFISPIYQKIKDLKDLDGRFDGYVIDTKSSVISELIEFTKKK